MLSVAIFLCNKNFCAWKEAFPRSSHNFGVTTWHSGNFTTGCKFTLDDIGGSVILSYDVENHVIPQVSMCVLLIINFEVKNLLFPTT